MPPPARVPGGLGRVFGRYAVRQDALDTLVWDGVIELLANPSLVRAEIDRRLLELRASHPVDVKRDVATKELARIRAAITRLIEAYQEQLISLDELRTRMPSLRHREMAVQSQLAALEAELLDAETYITLAESFEGFLAKLYDAAASLDVIDRQRVLRLLVKEVQVGPEVIVIKHSIPMPVHHPDPGYLLRTWHHDDRNAHPVECRGHRIDLSGGWPINMTIAVKEQGPLSTALNFGRVLVVDNSMRHSELLLTRSSNAHVADSPG